MNGQHANAVAGPSTLPAPPPAAPRRTPTSSLPHDNPPLLFLPAPLPPPPRQHLAATQDLLARFNLLSAYDRYVRPAVVPGDDPNIPNIPDGAAQTPGPGADKGKGKERDGPTDGHAHDGEEEEAAGKGEKKKKNTYKHLIKNVPGKHSLKKDDFLSTIMLQPPKQRMRIRPFDQKTQNDAFTVSLEGLKGWNVNTLVIESDQAREDRKKRKELKRLAKLQGLQGLPVQSGIPTPVATTSMGTPRPSSSAGTPQAVQAPTPVSIQRRPSGVGTPKTSTPRPGSRADARTPVPPPISAYPVQAPTPAAGPGTPASSAPTPGASAGGGAGIAGTGPPRNGIPRSTVPRPGSTVPRPGSTVPRPGSAAAVAKKQQQQQLQAQAHVPQAPQLPGQAQRPTNLSLPQRPATPAHTPMDVDSGHRGQKRLREDGAGVGNQNPYAAQANPSVNGHGAGYANGAGGVNGIGNGNGQVPARPPVMNSKAGSGGVRPRPVKKQRMDTQGQARDVSQPVQQPTPQGA